MLSVLTFRTPAEAVEKANNTPYGLSAGHLDREGLAHPVDGRASCAPAWCGPTRSTSSTRPPRSAATRSRATAARAAGTAWRPTLPAETSSSRESSVRKTYKLYIGGAFPRSESGRSYAVTDATGTFLANAALASRKDARDAVVAARKAFGRLVRRDARTTAGRSSTGSPRCWRAAAPSSSTRSRAGRGRSTPAGRQAVVDAADRPLGLVRRLGRQDRPGRRRRQPGRRPVLQPLARPSRPASSRVVAPAGVVAARAWSACSPRRSSPATPSWSLASRRPAAAGDHPGRGAGHLRPARRRGQRAHRPRSAETAPCAGRAHGRQRDRPDRRRGDPELATELEVAAADNLKRVLRARPPSRTGPPSPGSTG